MDRQIPEKPEAATEMFQNRNVGGQKRWRSEKSEPHKNGNTDIRKNGCSGKGELK